MYEQSVRGMDGGDNGGRGTVRTHHEWLAERALL